MKRYLVWFFTFVFGITAGWVLREKTFLSSSSDRDLRQVVTGDATITPNSPPLRMIPQEPELLYKNDIGSQLLLRTEYKAIATRSKSDALAKASQLRGMFRTAALLGVVEGLMRVNPQECIDWIATDTQLINADTRYALAMEAARQAASSDAPLELVQYSLSRLKDATLSGTFNREYYYSRAIAKKVISGLEVSAISDPDIRKSAIDGVVTGLVELNARDALHWARTLTSNADIESAMRKGITKICSLDGQITALNWVNENAENLTERQVDVALSAIGVAATNIDPEANIAILDSISDKKLRDSVIQTQATINLQIKPEFSFQIGTYISDPKLRATILNNSAMRINSTDPARAATLISNSPKLSEEERKLLMAKLKLR